MSFTSTVKNEVSKLEINEIEKIADLAEDSIDRLLIFVIKRDI